MLARRGKPEPSESESFWGHRTWEWNPNPHRLVDHRRCRRIAAEPADVSDLFAHQGSDVALRGLIEVLQVKGGDPQHRRDHHLPAKWCVCRAIDHHMSPS